MSNEARQMYYGEQK